jgi:hypothetical protein
MGPFQIVPNNPALHSRWLMLLKIEIFSNGQNCSILSQNVPKFELYKHNDELFSIYYRIYGQLKLHPPFFSILSLAAILVGSRDQRTQFWKGAIKESFQQSLVDIGLVVSEEKIFF